MIKISVLKKSYRTKLLKDFIIVNTRQFGKSESILDGYKIIIFFIKLFDNVTEIDSLFPFECKQNKRDSGNPF